MNHLHCHLHCTKLYSDVPGAHPTNMILLKFGIWSKFGVLWFDMRIVDHRDFFTHYNNVTVMICKVIHCDQLNIWWKKSLQTFIEFRIRLKYRKWDGCMVKGWFWYYLGILHISNDICISTDDILELWEKLLNLSPVQETYTAAIGIESSAVSRFCWKLHDL